MFIKIKHNNRNEERVAIINTREIISLGEKHQEPTRLYDENGDLVEERVSDTKLYVLVLKNGFKYEITETEYSTIEQALLSIVA